MDNTSWDFTTENFEPWLEFFSPNNQTVPVDTDLSLYFSEQVRLGHGAVTVRRLSDDEAAYTFTVVSGSIHGATVYLSGNVVTLDPDVDLASDTAYYIQVAPGTFEDLRGLPFSGMLGFVWQFTTEAALDTVAPQLVSVTPSDNATDVSLSGYLMLSFDEAVQGGNGALYLYEQGDPSPFITITMSGGSVYSDNAYVSLSGSTVFIVPPSGLVQDTTYYVHITSGAIVDLAGNAFTGFMDNTSWDFTTESIPLNNVPRNNTGYTPPLALQNSPEEEVEPLLMPALEPTAVSDEHTTVIIQAFKSSENETVEIPVNSTISNHTLVYYYDELYKTWIAVPTTMTNGVLSADVPLGSWVSVQENAKVYQPADTIANWANKHILKMMSLNVLQGFTDNSFKPNELTNRYQFAVAIAKILQLDVDGYSSQSYSNEELGAMPDWVKPYVAAVSESGIMVGNGSFGGEEGLTRAQLAAIIGRILSPSSNSTRDHSSYYSDASDIPDWAKEGVQKALDANILQGYPDGSFQPEGILTRAEMAAVAARLMEYLEKAKNYNS